MNKHYFFVAALLSSILFFIYSCGEDSRKNLGLNAKISECGGFTNDVKQTLKVSDDTLENSSDESEPENRDCGDEVLNWQYNRETNTVTFQNSNVWLNCCGNHSIKIHYNQTSDIYEIAEKDSPVKDARCGCMCLFDFHVSLADISHEKIKIKLTIDVTDSKADKQTVIDATELNLTESSGSIIIEENVGFCD